MQDTSQGKQSRAVAVIPARAGSKRIPNKNRADLGGRPLVWYTIDWAIAEIGAGRVYVTTDDSEIARIARDMRVQVINRPAELARDQASSGAVIGHAANAILADQAIDWLILLQPTNPFRPRGLLQAMLARAEVATAPSVIAVTPVRLKFGRLDAGDRFHPVNYVFGQRSQDMKNQYVAENGLCYVTHRDLARTGTVIGDAPVAVVVDSWHGAIDIDEPEDLEAARAVLHRYREEMTEHDV